MAGLDPEQREVAQALRGPVVVLAGAGTGKTRAITHRMAYGVACGVFSPGALLAVTFTARAASEMRSRLRMLDASGVQVRTFHAAALRQLQFFWPRVVGGELPRLMDHKAPLVSEAAARIGLRADRAAIRDLAAEIEWSKVTQVHRDDYAAVAVAAGRATPAGLSPGDMGRLLGTYEDVKRERDLIDFEDVLVYAVGLLADREDVATQIRTQYRHFVVDEYQDVSPLQQSLLQLWLGDSQELCVVGDPSQTIYSFTGATPEHLLRFRSRYPQAQEVRLIRDYRSTPQVVGLANAVLARARVTDQHRPLQLVAQRPDGPRPRYVDYADETAEATGVAVDIAALIERGVAAAQIAVLFRTNSQSEAYEQALASAGISYVLRGGERFFDRREVRDAHLLLRGAARSGSGDDPAVEAARAVLSSMGWTAHAPAGAGAVRTTWESLTAVVALAEQLTEGDPQATLTTLVAELDERATARHAPTVDAVTLASLHAAKGLEWDAVFLVGLVEGLLPITYAETDEAVDEERRLFYVGVTRAREHVVLSWSRARGRRPSRFLDGLRPRDRAGSSGSSATRTRRPGRTPAATTCSVCSAPLAGGAQRKLGRCDDCPATYDVALYERLKEWRKRRSDEQSVPAYVVFTDATLTAIAEKMPTDRAALARVSGVGATKLDRYGPEVLALLSGADLASPTG